MKNKLLYLLSPLLFCFTSITAQIQQIDVPIQQTPCNINSISLIEDNAINIFFDNSSELLSFSISNYNYKTNISIRVVSMLGQSIYSSDMSSSEQNFKSSIKLPNIKKGIYDVIIQAGDKTFSKKIITL